jgi:NAD(P)H dehydrogenase (quinone)
VVYLFRNDDHAIKKLIDESIKYFGEFNGKIGGAFASCGSTGGRGEIAGLDILEAPLIHGKIIHGPFKGGHHGSSLRGQARRIL